MESILSIHSQMIENLQSQRKVASNIHVSPVNTSPIEFGSALEQVINSVNKIQVNASEKVRNYELGINDDLIGATIANQKASLSFNALMHVRNKMVSNFNDIIKMPV